MSPPPALALKEVVHGYGGRWRLDLPSLEVEPGEILGILGPTGAGKSTLLRLLHLLERPAAGEVFLDGRRVTFPPRLGLRRSIGMVFQRPVMLAGSVRDNVGLGLRLRGQADDGRVDQLLRDFDLHALAGRDSRSLSGGETQRVALARAVAHRPEVLLLDEPAANLDPGHAAAIEAIILAIHRSRGTTVVLATHQLGQARRLAHRTGLLVDGRLVEIEATQAFFDRPRDRRTAAFLRGDLGFEDGLPT